MVQVYLSKLNKAGPNWLQTNGGFNFTSPIFRAQIGRFPDVMELFHWLTHPPSKTTEHMHCPAFINAN